MLPGFVEGIKDTWNYWWNSKDKTNSTIESTNENSAPSVEDLHPVTEVPEPLKKADSLVGELVLLKAEAIANAMKKVQRGHDKIQQGHGKNKELTDLQAAITKQIAKDGSLQTDTALKLLLEKAKNQGVALTIQDTYTKDEVSKLNSNIELRSRNLETDLKLAINETQESIHTRNLFYQELKSIWDKFFEAIKKIINGIISR